MLHESSILEPPVKAADAMSGAGLRHACGERSPRGRDRAGCEDARGMSRRTCGMPPRMTAPARSGRAAYWRLHRVKGTRPAEPGALAALDPAAAAICADLAPPVPDRSALVHKAEDARHEAGGGWQSARLMAVAWATAMRPY